MTNQIIISIDNDECIGSFADLSLLYGFLQKINFNKTPDIKLFVEIINKTGCIRPYVKNLYDTLINLRKTHVIDKIYMCTAASNCTGWVTFLKSV
jgi:hypothetical protein